jgi:UPF0148 protein
MSDSDDGFDKEAAREELREKYENEREDREATARMSELLLQGATMTNDHCDRCGTPLFRHSGQTFCPTCQHEAQQASQQQAGQQQTDAQAGQQADGQQLDSQQTPPADQQQGQPPEAGDQSRQPADNATTGAETPPRSDADQQPSAPAPNQAPEHANRDRNLPEHAPTAGQSQSGEAAAALDSSIAALARRAASADDPRTAREYLEAAREAAEALAALR